MRCFFGEKARIKPRVHQENAGRDALTLSAAAGISGVSAKLNSGKRAAID